MNSLYMQKWQMKSFYFLVCFTGRYIYTNYKPTYWKLQGCDGALMKLGVRSLIGRISWSVDHSAHMALGGSKFLLAHILQQEGN